MVPIAVRHALAITTFFAISHSSDIRCFHLIYGLKMIVKFLSFPTQLLYHRVFIFAMDSLSIYKICNKFKLSFMEEKEAMWI